MNKDIKYIQAKSILSKLRQTDAFFGITYNMNLYRGCQHGCIYCDTRSDCYGVGDISQISVKQNALDLLTRELKLKRKNKGTIGTGSMNDPYMPVEKDLEITRNAMKIIASEKFPVHVITKSDLITRDLDVLQEIAKTYAAGSITITTFDDKLSAKIEPLAPLSSARFKAIEQLASNGIYTGITLMPLLPYINDDIENLENIIKKAKDCGASYIIPMFGLTLRKGSRDFFYKSIDNYFPEMKEKYVNKFGENYICNSPEYYRLQRIFTELTDKLGIDTRMNFYKPENQNRQLSLF
ncbi:MAG: radical SAM protein [Bacteroidales bacterium]|jgi:DNA repair photolyase|nr:radical SAM protein [Bacteroidales bacterium]